MVHHSFIHSFLYWKIKSVGAPYNSNRNLQMFDNQSPGAPTWGMDDHEPTEPEMMLSEAPNEHLTAESDARLNDPHARIVLPIELHTKN